MIDSRFMGMVFNNIFTFSGFMDMFLPNSFICEPFRHFWISTYVKNCHIKKQSLQWSKKEM